MIERLRGRLAARTAEGAVIDVGGVGFLVELSAVSMRDLPAVGEEVGLFTHLHVREEALQLFGFSSEEERELFRMLLGVSKIGPRLALAALSVRRAPDLKRAIAAGDVGLFATVPGIGKKTAERLILELKEKVGEVGTLPGGRPLVVTGDGGDLALARAALVELGMNPVEAERLLAQMEPGLSVEDLVRRALSRNP